MAAPRFVADPPDCYRIVELDELSALYHLRSGLTHILAPPAPQLIALLAEAPADLDAIAAAIADRFEVEDADALAARLAELEAAGLVSRL